jgi:hypothetical protein
MAFVVAALLLLSVQQVTLPGPAVPLPNEEGPPRIESLLDGRSSSVDAVALTGRVVDASPTWGEGVRLTVDVEIAREAPAEGLVSVSLRQTSHRWRTGDRLALSSRLRRVNGFGNFGELDWAAYNARRGIFVTVYAWRDEDVERLEADDSPVDRVRRRFAKACAKVGGQSARLGRTGARARVSRLVLSPLSCVCLCTSCKPGHPARPACARTCRAARAANVRPKTLEAGRLEELRSCQSRERGPCRVAGTGREHSPGNVRARTSRARGIS